MHEKNALGQSIGVALPQWAPPPRPAREAISGRYCRLEPLLPRHVDSLYEAFARDEKGAMWTYLPYGPFESSSEYGAWVESVCEGQDPLFYAVVDERTARATGVTSYLRIEPEKGAIEVGHIAYSPLLQRTRAATEAMWLMMRKAFELGYRRYEWKCDSLNAPSCRAAERLGFSFEGIFRQATIYKGRNRDTAWFSVIDQEWPALDRAFAAWLDPGNFDGEGRQRASLQALRTPS